MNKDMNIVIAGLGVIGGSFAMGLSEAGFPNVYGVDTDEETLVTAKRRGLIRDGSRTGDTLFPKADLVILAIYPKIIKDFFLSHMHQLKDGAVITDTTGIKQAFIREILEVLPDRLDFVFGHPMAGREKKGIDYATNQVFQGANYILTPTDQNRGESLDLIEELALCLGFRRVRRITPALHDEMIGFTSQLPHAMAVALINSDLEGRDTGSFIGDSYRDLTRIANINDELWSELFLGNRENLLQCVQHFEDQLDLIKDALKQEDKDALRALFQKSTARREALDA